MAVFVRKLLFVGKGTGKYNKKEKKQKKNTAVRYKPPDGGVIKNGHLATFFIFVPSEALYRLLK
ncbi:MAG: hypothetical protein K6B45_08615 [Bacteroidaceae bacterium]|nr:hypothetical protein [Bacteroidaceae bacterium]